MTRALLSLWLLVGCGAEAPRPIEPAPPEAVSPPLPWERSAAAHTPVESPLVAIRGGTVMTAEGRVIPNGVVLIEDGHIQAVGAFLPIPDDAEVIDATGRFVTPGIIDAHSHLGVYASPSLASTDDGNEATAPVTAEVWAADSIWPQDPGFQRALAAGVTTIQVLPGSANLVGGRGVIVRTLPARTVREMLFEGAPDTLKMACGENPKRVYGERHSAPSTRMGNVAGYRREFQRALEYGRSYRDYQHNHRTWQTKQRAFLEARADVALGEPATDDEEDAGAATPPDDPGPAPAPPARDFGLESLLAVIEGRSLVQIHCYRAEEMARMMELASEFGFHVRSFHHAVEAYKIRGLLRDNDVAISTWADWWGFKLEAFDAIPENLALLTESGVRGIVHSDSEMLIQRLGQEAGKAMTAGREAGIEITDDQALRWLTANPAWALGIDDQTGTLEPGKRADVVVWSGSPFSVYAHPDLVFVDGRLVHDRLAPIRRSDFELEQGMGMP